MPSDPSFKAFALGGDLSIVEWVGVAVLRHRTSPHFGHGIVRLLTDDPSHCVVPSIGCRAPCSSRTAIDSHDILAFATASLRPDDMATYRIDHFAQYLTGLARPATTTSSGESPRTVSSDPSPNRYEPYPGLFAVRSTLPCQTCMGSLPRWIARYLSKSVGTTGTNARNPSSGESSCSADSMAPPYFGMRADASSCVGPGMHCRSSLRSQPSVSSAPLPAPECIDLRRTL